MAVYERLQAWQECHALVLEVYRVTQGFPDTERYGITAQARRAAYSAAANIAEGSAKRGRSEFRRYLDISLGSLAEVTYSLRLARDLGFLDDTEATRLGERLDRAGKLVWGLYRVQARLNRAEA